MLKMTKAALIAALLISGTGVAVPSPADAAKKKEEAPKGPELSPEFRKAAVPAQEALKAKDLAKSEPAVVAAEAAAKTPDDIYYAQIFRLQYESIKLEQAANGDSAIYRQGEPALVAPLSALIANPKTPQEDVARFNYRLGLVQYDQKKYAEAAASLTKARDLGEKTPDLTLSLVKAYIEGGNVEQGAAEMKRAIAQEKAAGKAPPETWYDYIIPRLGNAGKEAEFIQWSQDKLTDYPSAKNWRQLIVYYGLAGKRADNFDKQQKIDLFRLLRANHALADLADYSQFARYLQDSGLPVEAVAVLDEGKSSGKMQLTREDDKALYASAQNSIKLDGPVGPREAKALAAKDGAAAAATGNAYLGEGNYAKAIELYTAALGKGVTKPDEVTTRLGIAYALSGDKAMAKATFAKVTTEPRAQIAKFWTAWVDGAAPAA